MSNIKLNCVNCDKEFEKYVGEYNSQIKSGRTNFFCCLSCSVSFQMKCKSLKEKEKYDDNPKHCKCCNGIIPYEYRHSKSFCNQSCAATFNNKKRKNQTVKCCKHCGKSDIKSTYCSQLCKSKESHTKTMNEIESGRYPFKRNKPYKEYLISKHGHKCQICSFTDWGGKPILLILDHIDGNSDNFNLENLRIICSNCDTLTSTYKGKNKGRGRFSRKQRYHDGKSF